MDTFLQLSSEQRRSACLQVDEKMHLQALSVEKDFWVCWTLRKLNQFNVSTKISNCFNESLARESKEVLIG